MVLLRRNCSFVFFMTNLKVFSELCCRCFVIMLVYPNNENLWFHEGTVLLFLPGQLMNFVYLIFIFKFAAPVGRKRKCLTSVSYHLTASLSSKNKVVNITAVFSEYSFKQPSLVLSEYFEQYRFLCVYIIKHNLFFHVI